LPANKNSFRYRSYYYDSDLGLYYLGSRYYDSNTGRFISADTSDVLTATPNALTDKNLFAYCDNNPVMRADSDGEFWHVLVGTVVGAVVSATAKIVTNVISGDKWYNGIGVAAATGAISGFLSSVGVPAAVMIAADSALSAAQSIYDDVKSGDKSVANIATNAVISAGVSALFSAASGPSNGKQLNNLYKQSKHAKNSLKSSGLNPTVKSSLKSTIKTYNKQLKKFAISNFTETPVIGFITNGMSYAFTNVSNSIYVR